MFKFPKIYRFITEKPILIVFVSFILVLASILVGLGLYQDLQKMQDVRKDRQELEQEKDFWQLAVDRYYDYRDGFFQLALIEYRLQNFNSAQEYLKRVFEIDPNYQKGRGLEQRLNSKY